MSWPPIELVPSLSHCIETVAKEEFREAVDQCLRTSEPDAALEERVETLRLFLETADFRALRQESESYLTQGRPVRFILWREGKAVGYRMLLD